MESMIALTKEVTLARFRVSIAGLMAFVAIAGLGMVGLKEGTEFWASTAFTVTILILAGSVLSVAYSRGARRATWIGFAVFGWGYLIWNLGPWSDSGLPKPLTNPLLSALHEQIHPVPQYIPNPNYPGQPSPSGTITDVGPYEPQFIPKPGSVEWQGDSTSYLQVGQCLATLLFGCIGAAWSRGIAFPGK